MPQYKFNFRDAHSYRTFPRLLQLLFCRRYDDHGKHILQTHGERNGRETSFCNYANSVVSI